MKVTIVTTMRNEGRHLLEWVAYHKVLGVTDFLVYTNDCDDGTDAMLDLLPDVTHVPLGDGEKPPQWRALKAAWDHPKVAGADWVACIDCDEFINLGKGLRDIAHLIASVEADAILLPWRLFGNSGHVDFHVGLTIDAFTSCAPNDMLYPAIGSYFKTLFRRNGPFRQLGVHRPKQKNPEKHGMPVWADGSGQKISGALAKNDGQIMNWGKPIANDLVQLNHYSVRSVSDFMVKRSRGLPNHQKKPIDLTYWVERNFNSTVDRSITGRVSNTVEIMSEFKNIHGIADVERRAQKWVEDRLAAMIMDPSELNLFGRLILAGSSEPPSRDRALGLVKAYQVAHAK